MLTDFRQFFRHAICCIDGITSSVFAAATTAGDGPRVALDLLTRSGFNTSPSTLAAFPSADLLKDVPANGALVLFDPDDPLGELAARVVRKFLRAGTVLAAPPGTLPDGVDVAVVAGSAFRQGPESGAEGCV